jgi:penicillin-binding protein 1A
MQKVYDDPSLKISTKDFEVPAQYDNSIFNCSRSEGGPSVL